MGREPPSRLGYPPIDGFPLCWHGISLGNEPANTESARRSHCKEHRNQTPTVTILRHVGVKADRRVRHTARDGATELSMQQDHR